MIVPISSRIATGYTSAFDRRHAASSSSRVPANHGEGPPNDHEYRSHPGTAQGTVPVHAGIGIETDWLSVYVPPNEGKPSSEPSVIRVKLHCTVTVT